MLGVIAEQGAAASAAEVVYVPRPAEGQEYFVSYWRFTFFAERGQHRCVVVLAVGPAVVLDILSVVGYVSQTHQALDICGWGVRAVRLHCCGIIGVAVFDGVRSYKHGAARGDTGLGRGRCALDTLQKRVTSHFYAVACSPRGWIPAKESPALDTRECTRPPPYGIILWSLRRAGLCGSNFATHCSDVLYRRIAFFYIFRRRSGPRCALEERGIACNAGAGRSGKASAPTPQPKWRAQRQAPLSGSVVRPCLCAI